MLMHEFCVLQSSGPMSASETRRSMMDFLDTIMSDIHSHSEGGQYSSVKTVWEAIKVTVYLRIGNSLQIWIFGSK